MMEKQDQQIHIIQQRFDNIVIKHIERLLGTRSGIGGFPLNLLTISCLIFLAEQYANEQEKFSTPEERYTHDTLLKELEEVGLGSNTALKEVLENMFQKGYVDIAEAGSICPKDPVFKMAQRIDKVLPKMPGLSFVAYIAQTIDEVASQRKDIESAATQFDQTLTLQGVPLNVEVKKPIRTFSGKQPQKKKDDKRSSIYRSKKDRPRLKSGNLLSAADYEHPFREARNSKNTSEESSGSKIISSSGVIEKKEIQAITFGAVPSTQEEPETTSGIMDADMNSRIPDNPDEKKEDTAVETPVVIDEALTQTDASVIPKYQEPGPLNQNNENSDNTASNGLISERQTSIQDPVVHALGSEETLTEQTKPKVLCDPSPDRDLETGQGLDRDDAPVITQDDIIEMQINSFEDNLAMQCPVCKTGKIVPEKTMKNKTYYKCPNKTCNFISWGKPYHHVCPRCQNPFLIESKKDGATILKCPRATCRYWQGELKEDSAGAISGLGNTGKSTDSPKPRRRVVKRRVVRRKR